MKTRRERKKAAKKLAEDATGRSRKKETQSPVGYRDGANEQTVARRRKSSRRQQDCIEAGRAARTCRRSWQAPRPIRALFLRKRRSPRRGPGRHGQLAAEGGALKDQSLADSIICTCGPGAAARAQVERHLPTPRRVLAVALSRDGKTAAHGERGQNGALWETATGQPIGTAPAASGGSWPWPSARDGKNGSDGESDSTARLWETATGKPIGPPLQHEGLSWPWPSAPDGKTALTGSYDKTARLWDTATGKPIGPPLQHQDWVVAVALSADGKTALTGSCDETARLWEAATGKPIGPPLQHQARVMAVALSADGKTALTGSGTRRRGCGRRRPASRSGRPCSIKTPGRVPWP